MRWRDQLWFSISMEIKALKAEQEVTKAPLHHSLYVDVNEKDYYASRSQLPFPAKYRSVHFTVTLFIGRRQWTLQPNSARRKLRSTEPVWLRIHPHGKSNVTTWRWRWHSAPPLSTSTPEILHQTLTFHLFHLTVNTYRLFLDKLWIK